MDGVVTNSSERLDAIRKEGYDEGFEEGYKQGALDALREYKRLEYEQSPRGAEVR